MLLLQKYASKGMSIKTIVNTFTVTFPRFTENLASFAKSFDSVC